jgi:Ca-activated chloride channel homolog
MVFQSSWILFFLLLIPVLYWIGRKRGGHPRIIFGNPLPRIHQNRFSADQIQLALKLLALSLLIVALARPQSPSKIQERKLSGVDIVVLLDVSLSMLIQDMGRGTRMDIAKDTIEQFVVGRSSDRVGLVVFSGEPLTLAPPTLDYGLVLQQLRLVQPGKGGMRDGTAIGDGLSLAVQRLHNSTAKSKVIVLLTDGDSNVGKVPPLNGGELAQGFGIKVYTIAAGTEGTVEQPLPQTNALGQTFYVKVRKENTLNTQLLEQISEMTKGKFFRVQDEKTLRNVFEEIDRLERSSVVQKERTLYEELYEPLVLIALALLVFERLLALAIWRQWS